MSIKGILTVSGLAWMAICSVPSADWASAQESGSRHRIAGKVVDEKGKAIVDAVVSLGPVPTLY